MNLYCWRDQTDFVKFAEEHFKGNHNIYDVFGSYFTMKNALQGYFRYRTKSLYITEKGSDALASLTNRLSPKQLAILNLQALSSWSFGGVLDLGYAGGGKCAFGHTLRYAYLAVCDTALAELKGGVGDLTYLVQDFLASGKTVMIFGSKCAGDMFDFSPKQLKLLTKITEETLDEVKYISYLLQVPKALENYNKLVQPLTTEVAKDVMWYKRELGPIYTWYENFLNATLPIPPGLACNVQKAVLKHAAYMKEMEYATEQAKYQSALSLFKEKQAPLLQQSGYFEPNMKAVTAVYCSFNDFAEGYLLLDADYKPVYIWSTRENWGLLRNVCKVYYVDKPKEEVMQHTRELINKVVTRYAAARSSDGLGNILCNFKSENFYEDFRTLLKSETIKPMPEDIYKSLVAYMQFISSRVTRDIGLTFVAQKDLCDILYTLQQHPSVIQQDKPQAVDVMQKRFVSDNLSDWVATVKEQNRGSIVVIINPKVQRRYSKFITVGLELVLLNSKTSRIIKTCAFEFDNNLLESTCKSMLKSALKDIPCWVYVTKDLKLWFDTKAVELNGMSYEIAVMNKVKTGCFRFLNMVELLEFVGLDSNTLEKTKAFYKVGSNTIALVSAYTKLVDYRKENDIIANNTGVTTVSDGVISKKKA